MVEVSGTVTGSVEGKKQFLSPLPTQTTNQVLEVDVSSAHPRL